MSAFISILVTIRSSYALFDFWYFSGSASSVELLGWS